MESTTISRGRDGAVLTLKADGKMSLDTKESFPKGIKGDTTYPEISITLEGKNVLPSDVGLDSYFDQYFSGDPLVALKIPLDELEKLCYLFEESI